MRLRTRFALMMGLLAAGFTVFGLAGYLINEQLRVNGPVYRDIVRGKDLIADILPPPAYIIESKLTAHELLEAEPAARPALIARLERLQQEFETRSRYWTEQALSAATAGPLHGAAREAATRFYRLAREQFLPALQTDDSAAARAALAQMSSAYAQHRAAIDQVVERANAENAATEAQAAAAIERAHWGLAAVFVLSMAASLALTRVMARRLLNQLGGEPDTVLQHVQRVAGGDLNLPPTAAPAHSLLDALQAMTKRIADVVRSIDEGNREIGQSIFQISTMSSEIAAISAQQQTESGAVGQATRTLRELLAELARQASAAQAKTAEVDAQARAGMLAMQENIAEMEQAATRVSHTEGEVRSLAESAGRIDSIVASIKAIAEQTNLLALNAAIEAARAGESGRGFAVVADEVRKLAHRTSDATRDIETIVAGLNGQVERTLDTMGEVVRSVQDARSRAERSGSSIEQMAAMAQDSSAVSRHIAEASADQIGHVTALDTRLDVLFSTLRSSESTLGVTHGISAGLHRTVEGLKQRIQFFRYDPRPTTTDALPDGQDKRQHRRARNTLLVEMDYHGARTKVLALDFSLGGMRLQAPTDLGLARDDQVELEIRIPGADLDAYRNQPTLQLRARVVRAVAQKGGETDYGVQFLNIDSTRRVLLERCVSFYTTAAAA